jgi:hypothetical protein
MERFDWRTGGCLAPLPEGWPSPRVKVLRRRAEALAPPRAGSARRPGLIQIERILERAGSLPVPAEAPRRGRPGRIDLAADPGAGAVRGGRLGRLLALAMSDPDLLRGGPPGDSCARAGRRLAPAASSRLVAEAARWLESWIGSALHGELRDAARGRRPILAGLEWTVAWRSINYMDLLILGSFDLMYRDRSGRWRPVVMAAAAGTESSTRLRLALAETAAVGLGLTPCGPAWRVEFGAGGSLAADAVLPASTDAVEAALAEWFEEHRQAAGLP